MIQIGNNNVFRVSNSRTHGFNEKVVCIAIGAAFKEMTRIMTETFKTYCVTITAYLN
jgi:hypothetical protein